MGLRIVIYLLLFHLNRCYILRICYGFFFYYFSLVHEGGEIIVFRRTQTFFDFTQKGFLLSQLSSLQSLNTVLAFPLLFLLF